ncbi:MAG: lipase [Ktedonobacteraceae bacterium]
MQGKHPVVIVPGLFARPQHYRAWVQRLEALSAHIQVFVVDASLAHWQGTLTERFGPLLQLLGATVAEALRQTGASKVTLIGHSAGGRVARLWLSDRSYNDVTCGGHWLTRALIMLGAANQTQEPWSRKSVAWANRYAPGAFYPNVTYVTVIGKAVQARLSARPQEILASINYRVQGGLAGQWGDGVIPVTQAALPGATNMVIEGIWHVAIAGRPGYESAAALECWARPLLPIA